jgi:hypothetical protein
MFPTHYAASRLSAAFLRPREACVNCLLSWKTVRGELGSFLITFPHHRLTSVCYDNGRPTSHLHEGIAGPDLPTHCSCLQNAAGLGSYEDGEEETPSH